MKRKNKKKSAFVFYSRCKLGSYYIASKVQNFQLEELINLCIVLYCIASYCKLYCIVLYCIALHCIVLYCIVSYCIDKTPNRLYKTIFAGIYFYNEIHATTLTKSYYRAVLVVQSTILSLLSQPQVTHIKGSHLQLSCQTNHRQPIWIAPTWHDLQLSPFSQPQAAPHLP